MNEEIILKKFAERFSTLVKNSSFDITKLAEILGLKSKSTIYRYMNAEMTPKLSTVKYAAELFNVNPRWLMGYDVAKEQELPYFAIYNFSTNNEKELLNSSIIYAIQNDIPEKEIPEDEFIKELLNRLNTLNIKRAIEFVQYFANKYRGMDFFDLADCIESLRYYKVDNESPKIKDMYMHLAKEAQDLKLEQEDIDYIINFYKRNKK